MKLTRRSTDGESGYILVFVLIFLVVGTLVLVPVLNYATTALRAQRISEAKTLADNAVDSAILDAIWRILDGGEVLDHVHENEDGYEYYVEGGRVVIQVPGVSSGEWEEWQLWFWFYGWLDYECKVDVFLDMGELDEYGEPYENCDERFVEPWVPAADDDPEVHTFYYVVRFNMPWRYPKVVTFTLPPGLELNEGSAVSVEDPLRPGDDFRDTYVCLSGLTYDGQGETELCGHCDESVADNHVSLLPLDGDGFGEFTEIIYPEGDGDRQKVTWTSPQEQVSKGTVILVFEATGTLSGGTYELGLVVDDHQVVSTATIAAGVYTITIDVEGQHVVAVVAETEDGFELLSYHIIE